MEKLLVRGQTGQSEILIGATLDEVTEYINSNRIVIITDSTVKSLYQTQFPNCPTIEIGLTEKIKTLKTVENIYSRLIDLEADRSTFILGIGGGIVCDVTGFVASTYMRGTRFGFISTTLLSQVDASVGGKNGVNFGGFKNMMGVFNQPEFVICDLNMLNTLPEKEIRNGFSEIIKHGAIADGRMLDFIEENVKPALALEPSVVEKLVVRSVEIKADVVTQDEKEHGQRRKLNFGHTFGHAIEKLTGIPHGEAVGIGMVLAAKLSVEKGLIDAEDARRLEKIIQSYGLPTQCPVKVNELMDAMKKDKKRSGARIHFVFLSALGRVSVQALAIDELFELAKALPVT